MSAASTSLRHVDIGIYESLLTEGLNEQIQTRPGLVPAYGTVDDAEQSVNGG